ncbi:hypothetical protein IFM46972_06172 [Aspergillus udagawae]|uniref:Uncharacterized protein n=1 Tax=Aspergillus udagawae TaxID=91492 RepID=A0A8H3NX07_9EURO|nr:hypothetical protein IFM46972_06172 [Aspergillus udagawae]
MARSKGIEAAASDSLDKNAEFFANDKESEGKRRLKFKKWFNNHTANVGPVELKELQVLASQYSPSLYPTSLNAFGPSGAEEEESLPDI